METTKKIKRVNKDEPTGFDRFNRVSKGANAVLNIIFIIMSLLCVIPILLVVAISFSAEDSITEYGYRFIPKIFSLEGYTFLASQSTMLLRALGVSLFVTIVGTVLGVMLTTLMGYVLSRPNYKLNGFLTMVVFIPMVFNGGLVSTYFVVSQLLGLKNTIWALILPLAVSSFNVIICRTFFKTTVPESLIESAKMDGASQLTIFSRIVLPISLDLVLHTAVAIIILSGILIQIQCYFADGLCHSLLLLRIPYFCFGIHIIISYGVLVRYHRNIQGIIQSVIYLEGILIVAGHSQRQQILTTL